MTNHIENRLRSKLQRDHGLDNFTTQDYLSALLLPVANPVLKKIQRLARITSRGEIRRKRSKKLSRELRKEKGFLKAVNNPIGKGAAQTEYVWVSSKRRRRS